MHQTCETPAARRAVRGSELIAAASTEFPEDKRQRPNYQPADACIAARQAPARLP